MRTCMQPFDGETDAVVWMVPNHAAIRGLGQDAVTWVAIVGLPAFRRDAGVPPEVFELEDDELEALLADMEAALVEAAARDEADALAAAEDADLAGLVERFQATLLDSPRVPCPGA